MSAVGPSQTTLRIGTRGSPLARWQAEWVADRLRAAHPGLAVELVEIKTQGDRDRNSPLAAIGGLGLFTKEIQRALSGGLGRGRRPQPEGPADARAAGADPGRRPPARGRGRRPDRPRHRTLDALPAGATRRHRLAPAPGAAPPPAARPERRRHPGERRDPAEPGARGTLDAVVLAEAGLRRLGLDGHVTERLGPPRFLPAVGQGALGIECRGDDAARSPCSPPSTTRRPAAPSSPSAGPWPSSKAAA